MKACVKSILALTVAALLMLAFRSLAFTIYTVGGDALGPDFRSGDRIMVNRWSYGLRTGSADGLFRYGRIARQDIGRGEIVAFDSPADSMPGVMVCRCRAVPGDTVSTATGSVIVPGRDTCADQEYYWMEALDKNDTTDSRLFGFVPENLVIGRVCMIVYNHDDAQPFYTGYRSDRVLIMK